MLYREIIAACSQIHTEHINTLCVQNVELLNVKLAVHIVTTGFLGCFMVYLVAEQFAAAVTPVPSPATVTFRRVRTTTVAAISVTYSDCFYNRNYTTHSAHASYCIVTCGLSACTTIFPTLSHKRNFSDKNVQYCAVLYCTLEYTTVLYRTVQCSTVLYCTALYSTVLYSTVQ